MMTVVAKAEYDSVIVDHVFGVVKCRFVEHSREIAWPLPFHYWETDCYVVPEDDAFANR